jgi:hypothetical protein
MAGAPAGHNWRAPGGESATGDRQRAALGAGIDGSSSVAHPAKIRTTKKGAKQAFIAAQSPVCPKIIKSQKHCRHCSFSSATRRMSRRHAHRAEEMHQAGAGLSHVDSRAHGRSSLRNRGAGSWQCEGRFASVLLQKRSAVETSCCV